MSVKELNREQLDELKCNYVMEIAKTEGRFPSYMELALAPSEVPDEKMYELFEHITFTEDDFFCTVGGC